MYTCPSCFNLLEVDYDYDSIAESVDRQALSSRNLRSMWRYREFLPVDRFEDVTLEEGFTPISTSTKLRAELGLGGTYFKHEFVSPTGSFKDRGSAVLVTRAKELGFRGVTIDSSGNAAASLATYCAREGLQCNVFMPSYASASKLIQCAVAAANVIKVNGTRQQTYEVANKARAKLRLFYCGFQTNSFSSEGMKTIGYEICEQFNWDPPDWIVFPVGTGSGLVGCFKGFNELKQLGWIDRLPSMACVQPEGCAPISRAAKAGHSKVGPVEKPASIAEGLLISKPLRGAQVLSVLAETQGLAESVTDPEIEKAARLLMSREGLFVEPSAAVSLAGLVKLVESGRIGRDEDAVCMLTGSGLKTYSFYLKALKEPVEVNPDADLQNVLKIAS